MTHGRSSRLRDIRLSRAVGCTQNSGQRKTRVMVWHLLLTWESSPQRQTVGKACLQSENAPSEGSTMVPPAENLSPLKLAEEVVKNQQAPCLRAAMLHLQLGETEHAQTLLENAFSKAPHNFAIPLIMALHLTNKGDILAADTWFRKAISAEPDQPDTLRAYALFHLGQNAPQKALRLLRMAAELTPHSLTIQLECSSVALLCYEYEIAKTICTRVLEQRPDTPLALRNLGAALAAQGHISAGKDILRKIEHIGHEAEAQELARILAHMEQTPDAPPLLPDDDVIHLAFASRSFDIPPFRILPCEQAYSKQPVALSVIVPIKNERENLPILYQEIAMALADLEQAWEIILIDDGSTDGSIKIMEDLAASDSRVTVIAFRRNYGQTAALSAGFKIARGDVVVTLDGDLQNDPADIPMLLEVMAQGYDMVCGWRRNRKDKMVTRRIPSLAANWIINKLIAGTGVQLHDFGCSLKAYKLNIIKNINLYGEMHRFIPVFAAWLGVRVAEVEVNHRPRTLGQTKYNLSRVWRVIFDLLPLRFFSDYMTRPIHFFGKIANYMLGLGLFGIAGTTIVGRLFGMPTETMLTCLMVEILLIGGLLILCQGLIGEVLIRTYFETQGKRQFVIERIIRNESSCVE